MRWDRKPNGDAGDAAGRSENEVQKLELFLGEIFSHFSSSFLSFLSLILPFPSPFAYLLPPSQSHNWPLQVREQLRLSVTARGHWQCRTAGIGLNQTFAYVAIINIEDDESLRSYRQGESVPVHLPDNIMLNRTQSRNGEWIGQP